MTNINDNEIKFLVADFQWFAKSEHWTVILWSLYYKLNDKKTLQIKELVNQYTFTGV